MTPRTGFSRLRFRREDGTEFPAWEAKLFGNLFFKVNERNNGQFNNSHWISVAKMYFQEPDKVSTNNIDTRTYVMRFGDMAFEGHPNSEFKYGRFVVNDIGDGVISELFPIYRHKTKYILKYWKYAIQVEGIMAPIYRRCITFSGASSNKLNEEDFLHESILVPCPEEQQKIADFLSTVDAKIAAQKNKLKSLEDAKKGLMQQIFSQQVRFRRDDGTEYPEWNVMPLSSIAEKVNRKAETNSTVPIMMISQGNGFILQSKKYAKDNTGQSLEKYTLLKRGEMAYNHGASKLKPYGVAYCLEEDEARIPFVYHAFSIINGVPEYWDYALNTSQMDRQLKKLISSSARMDGLLNITYDTYMQVRVSIPCLEEQQKIADFLSTFDAKIAAVQKKIEAWETIKKGLVQRLFA